MARRGDKFDGGDYLGIHDDPLQADQPLDVLRENQIASNTSYLWKIGSSCGSELVRGNTLRKLASVEPAYIAPFPIDVPLDPTPEEIRLTFACLVDDRAGEATTPEVTFELTLIAGGSPITESLTVGRTTGSGNNYESQLMTLDLSGVSDIAQWGEVWLTMESKYVESVSFTATVDPDTTESFSFAHGSDSSIDADLWISDYTQNDPIFDPVVGATPQAIDESSNPRTFIYNPQWAGRTIDEGITDENQSTDALETVEFSRLSFTSIKNWSLSFRYADESTGQYGPKDAAEMHAREAVRGADIGKHPSNLDETYGRYDLALWGSMGEEADSSTSWGDQSRRWPTIWADAANGSYVTLLDEKGLTLDRADGEINLQMHFLPLQFVNDPIANLNSGGPEGRFRELAAEAQWTIRATIEQLDPNDPGWATARTVVQETYQTKSEGQDAFSHFPCWKQAVFGFQPTLKPVVDQTFFNLIVSYWATWSSGRINEHFREGQLYRRAFQWAREHTYSIELDWSEGTNIKHPYRLRLDLRWDGDSTIPLKRGNDDNLERFAVQLVGLSGWQRGQV